MNPELVLHQFASSIFSQKVRLALVEKGVDFRTTEVDLGPRREHYDPAYARLNPGLTVPTLVVKVGDPHPRVLTSSTEMLRFIDEECDGRALFPTDAEARTQVDAWVERFDQHAFRVAAFARRQGLLGKMMRRSLVKRREKLDRLGRENPELEPVYRAAEEDVRSWQAQVLDAKAVDAVRDDMRRMLDEAEARLTAEKFLVGESYSMADAVLTVAVARFVMQDEDDALDWERRPGLKRWYEAMKRRPSFAEAQIWETLPASFVLPLLARSLWKPLLGFVVVAGLAGVGIWQLAAAIGR